MSSLVLLFKKLKTLTVSNPKLAKVLIAMTILYILKRFRNTYRYSKKQFHSTKQINKRAVLITGCDTGFGNSTAHRLHSIGFCVIATVLHQQSADKFNTSFSNKNDSCSFVMDITNIENICSVRQKVEEHLKCANKELWAVVNNAGVAEVGTFEMFIPKYMNLYTNVLLIGHLNVTREFLSLIEGRKNYKKGKLDLSFANANGGRIINISSASVHVPSNVWLLYGALKSAITYWSHSLRYELSPRFGIFCCAVEPEGYATRIWNLGDSLDRLKAEIDEKVWDIYEYDDFVNRVKEDTVKRHMHQQWEDVVDDIVHGLTARYPMKIYRPGWRKIFTVVSWLPADLFNKIINRPLK